MMEATGTSATPSSLTQQLPANAFGQVTQKQLDELAYFQQRYKEERDKRLRPDGLVQYFTVANNERLARLWEDPWVASETPVKSPVTDGESIKLLIIGAGAAGILQAVSCIKGGITADEICIVDVASGFGGAWYWNRYPGVECDTEAYCYMPMLEEMGHMPSRKFAPGEEFRRHYEHIAAKYDLQRRAMWQTWPQCATWDNKGKFWVIEMIQRPKGETENSVTVHAKYMVLATGVASAPKVPNLEGLAKYKGDMFHTARWNYAVTGGSPDDQQLWDLVGKKVGLIGNCASGGQCVAAVAKYASKVYVFQRTPARVQPKPNPVTDLDEWKTEIASKPGWQDERNRYINSFSNYAPDRPEHDKIQDNLTKFTSFCAKIGSPRDITPDQYPAWVQHLHLLEMEILKGVHKRVDETIKDPVLAAKLKAWYPMWCKRPVFSDDYLPTLNRPNVHLIDTDGKGVEKITEKGVVAEGKEFEVDVLILATGFQAPTGSPGPKTDITIKGQNGQGFHDKWKKGMSTFQGITTRSFPNLFWPGPMQSSISPAWTYLLGKLAEHTAYLITESSKQRACLQPTEAAEKAWGDRIASMSNVFAPVADCTPSYRNKEGSMTEEEKGKMNRMSLWGRGVDDYLDVLREWRERGDLEGYELN